MGNDGEDDCVRNMVLEWRKAEGIWVRAGGWGWECVVGEGMRLAQLRDATVLDARELVVVLLVDEVSAW